MLLLRTGLLWNRRLIQAIIWSLVYTVISGVGLYNYINWASPIFFLGVLCLLLVSIPGSGVETSSRFAYISVAFATLSIFLPVKTTLYLSCSAALLFVLENNYGKVRQAAVFTLLIMSPFFDYAANVFSFPIRLQLTSWAGSIMEFSGQIVLAEGNVLVINGNEFTVDPGCMGLNMMETSLLLGIMISSFYQEKFKAKLPGLTLVIILAIITILNTLSNLLRILTIVQFDIMPETAMHEIVGLACLVLYVIIPGAALTRVILKMSGKQLVVNAPVRRLLYRPASSSGLYILIMVAISFTTFNTFRHEKEKHADILRPSSIPGYSVKRIDSDIIQLSNPVSLVYIKNIRGFYSTEHNPMMCWKGSGYIFNKVKKSLVNGNSVYTAILTRDSEKLYTAWWYDNSKNRTISQLNWRWDAFKGGEDYSLVNITCSNYADLFKGIDEIICTGRLNKLL